MAVPPARLYRAFADADRRARWLPDDPLRVRTAIEPRSIRFDWGDTGTRVNVTVLAKADGKSTVAVEHVRLADAGEAERLKAHWRERLTVLESLLEDGALDG